MQINQQPIDLVTTIAGFPAATDTERNAEVQRLGAALDAERAALAIEQKRLAAKYGSSSTQAQNAAARLTTLDQQRGGIAVEVSRQAVRTPATAANQYVVVGRVFDSTGQGVAGATVAAMGSDGKKLAAAKTDRQGAFEVRVPIEQSHKESVEKTAVSGFQLQVTAGSSESPISTGEALQPVAGRFTYREIIVPDAPAKAKTK
jgi:hypothetical protein